MRDYFDDDKDRDALDDIGEEDPVAGALVDAIRQRDQTYQDGFAVLAERMEANVRLQNYARGGEHIYATHQSSNVLQAIPEHKRFACQQAEMEIDRQRRNGERPFAATPELYAASALWFRAAMKLQLPSKFGGQQMALNEELNRYERAFNDLCPNDEIMRKTTYQEGVDASGGFVVPTIIAGEILRIVQDSGVVISRCRHIPMGSNDLRIPNEATGVSVYWADELAATTSGEGVFGQNILTAKRLSGRATASIEAIEDSVIGLIPYIQNVMAEKIGKELDQECLEGDGTNFTGLVAESGVNSVATTTTDGEQITYIDLVKAVYAADESSVEDGCAWFMHRKVMGTIVAMVDGNDRPVFQPTVAGGVPNTILGFPVFTTSAISAARTRGSNATTSNVYFGNPRRMIMGDRTGLRFDVTDTGPNWEYYAVDMRLNGRWGFTVGTPAAFSKIVGAVPVSET